MTRRSFIASAIIAAFSLAACKHGKSSMATPYADLNVILDFQMARERYIDGSGNLVSRVFGFVRATQHAEPFTEMIVNHPLAQPLPGYVRDSHSYTVDITGKYMMFSMTDHEVV